MENTDIKNPELEDSTSEEQELENQPKYTQSDFDKLFSQARKKWEKESQKQLTEAQKLAKMSEEQKSQHELESRIKELEEKERQLAIRENQVTCLKVMAEKGIPTSLVDLIVHEDADTMNDRIKTVSKAIADAVNAQVKAKLGTTTPKQGTDINKEPTKEQFQKLSLSQKNEIFKTNPDLWKKLSQ